ncbi:MAG TPA: hypothetical protein VFI27_09230 [candidate division Zixibacteria bacterium]|nr:hypothetical protein [candidate division Zixibacteria bacterium]
MNSKGKANRKAVKREYAENYLLTSLVAFGVTVVGVRLFLDLSGYPQIGTSVLHIAHALWGALLLFIAVLLPLILANRWTIQTSALLSGFGIGLFIDEVGKFITQKNDYFFPPALPLIYGFFLMTVFLYLYFRRSSQEDSRKAMYHALDGLKDILDGDLDQDEAARIEDQLGIASRSQNLSISSLASALGPYLQQEREHLAEAKPSFWKKTAKQVDKVGRRIGRRTHRWLISIMLILWLIAAALTSALLPLIAFGVVDLEDEAFRATLSSSELSVVDSTFWLYFTLLLQLGIGLLVLLATIAWLRHNEERGQKVATFALILSLVISQPLLFYLNQLSALGGTLYQFVLLLILLAYRRWYLEGEGQ